MRGVATRRGFTLVELLVVILIIGLLAAVSLPVVVGSLDSRRIRETSRSITAYMAGARNAAMRNGRPVGVMFERYADPAGGTKQTFSIILRQVEVPAPYAGDTLNSRIQINGTTSSITGFPSNDVGWSGLIKIGDILRLNYQGILYKITGPTGAADTNGFFTVNPSSTPWTIEAVGTAPGFISTVTSIQLPYQIIRQPVKSSAQAMQLPESLVIDLFFSGSTLGELGTVATIDPIVLFAPDGTFNRTYGDSNNTSALGRPIGAVHFLLGKRERVGNLAATMSPPNDIADIANFRDAEAMWISIHPQSGLITAAEVAPADATGFATPLDASRLYAESGQAIGGR